MAVRFSFSFSRAQTFQVFIEMPFHTGLCSIEIDTIVPVSEKLAQINREKIDGVGLRMKAGSARLGAHDQSSRRENKALNIMSPGTL